MMKIIWSDTAVQHLEDIRTFYEDKSESAAIKICKKILDAADLLCKFPQIGVRESILEESPQDVRSFIVDKQFKIIYYIEGELIRIAAIWCCQQNDNKLKRLFKR